MQSTKHKSLNEIQVAKIAQNLAKTINKPKFICLYGNLGAGKTFFCKHFIKAIDSTIDNITSPSYNIVASYQAKNINILHVDLYLIKKQSEILDLAILEHQQDSIIIVEWAEYLEDFKPDETIDIFIKINEKDSNLRDLTIRA